MCKRLPLSLATLQGHEPLLPDDPVTTWFLDHGLRIVGTQPSEDDADLVRFVGMVGNARLIGAGEGTHGTRAFFELRHRLLRSLVLRRAGISAFAIEASMPDALELDRYVRDGVGDPVRALSRLYFWTWRTQEMLDLIRWIREYNSALPANQRIGFYGVDMQYPGNAVRRVMEWIPASLQSVRDSLGGAYACVTPFLNDDAGVFARRLDLEPAATRDRCLAGARAAVQVVSTRAAELRAATNDDAYELHSRLATIVVQWATRTAGQGGLGYRDLAMADNARWLLRRLPGRVFLWAHNAHISRANFMMGRYLRDSLGADYVNIATLFDSGSFNARPNETDAPRALTASHTPDSTYEGIPAPVQSAVLLRRALGRYVRLTDLHVCEKIHPRDRVRFPRGCNADDGPPTRVAVGGIRCRVLHSSEHADTTAASLTSAAAGEQSHGPSDPSKQTPQLIVAGRDVVRGEGGGRSADRMSYEHRRSSVSLSTLARGNGMLSLSSSP